ncbi:pregnancy-specific beta-1-glycoprotein 4-like [Hemibagrus wyckioides]|uniref:pregnancy-specific beta-1-glycoprotein 4-like n=1 Tax=Hemibagrus wyckioides TaxID=337641 RepID=UPI00266D0BD8|nr:pregnancy-specific beta-1-glycoprotein 4-like [Hemibagrus wyckioides]
MWRIMWKSSGGLWCLSDGKKDVGKEEVPGPPFLIYHPLVSVFVSGRRRHSGTYRCKLINSENGRERFSTDNTKQVVKIQSVKDSGTYTCSIKGRDSQSSEISDAVTLTVSAKPKATVRVNPQSSIYTGDTVTLSCELQGTGWVFDWYKNNQKQNLNSEQAKILNVTVDNAGETEYQCRASRLNFDDYGDTRYYYTDLSDPVKITVSAKPKLTVRVNPQSSVYTGDTVTLSCELQQETGWEFLWYRNNQLLQNLSRKQANTLKVTVDNAGETEYRCRANRINNNYYNFTEFSDPVKITVRDIMTADR